MTVTYVDTSALAKLLVDEAESEAVRRALQSAPVVSSVLAAVELATVARRLKIAQGAAAVDGIVRRTRLLPLSRSVLRRARGMDLPPLRTLELLHLLTARVAREALDVTTFVAYDRELLDAAQAEGFTVSSPS